MGTDLRDLLQQLWSSGPLGQGLGHAHLATGAGPAPGHARRAGGAGPTASLGHAPRAAGAEPETRKRPGVGASRRKSTRATPETARFVSSSSCPHLYKGC